MLRTAWRPELERRDRFGRSRRSVQPITCTTNGRTLTKLCSVSATGLEVPSMAWRWNMSIRRAAIRCPRYLVAFKLLRPDETTKTHRHNSSAIYHAFRGSGTTVIDGKKFDWDQGDCFAVPLGSWHSHQNRSKDKDAILFSMSDMPVMEALKLYREEAGEGA